MPGSPEDLIKLSGLTVEEAPIVFTGITPSEKLEEALWETGAASECTAHPDVLRVIERDQIGGPDLAELLRTFAAAADQGDVHAIKAMLMHEIPTFVPSIQGH